jgi:hypothetical protein
MVVGRLGVVALHGAGAGVQEAAVGVGGVGGRVGVGGFLRPALELPGRPALGLRCRGVGGDALLVGLLAGGGLGLQLRLGLPQPRQPAGLARQRLGQLVPTGVPEEPVLAPVGRGGLAQELCNLGLELLLGAVGAVGLVGGVAGQLGPIQRDRADPHHAGGRAQLQGLHEEARQGLLVAARNRAMVTWSGVWLAASTRKAMSSVKRRSSCWEERTPRQ